MRYAHKLTHIAILLLLPLSVSSGFRTDPFAGVGAQPNANDVQAIAFKSVSSHNLNQRADAGMRTSSYSIPFAANGLSGGMTTYDVDYESESTSSMRRVRGSGYNPGYDEEEPGTPIGDIPWIMMLLLAGGYIVYTARKRQRLCSSEKK